MKKYLIISVILIILVAAAVIYWQTGFQKPYYAVYLKTGDLYFGKLSRFPKLFLSDVWFLSRNSDQQNPFSVSRLRDAFWQPKDKLLINKSEIVWLAPLKEDSQLLDYIRNSSATSTRP